MRFKRISLLGLMISMSGVMLSGAAFTAPKAQQAATPAAETTIPIEVVNNHILMKIQVNNSQPFRVIFDTGDKVAVIDTSRAKALGLDLQGDIQIGGAGAGTLAGHYVKNSTFTIPGLAGFSQPVVLAIPLDNLAPYSGHQLEGIIGADFISQFVVEVDYLKQQMTLHDKDKFNYKGPGESIPITFDQQRHPHARTQILQAGREPIACEAVIDMGSGGAIALAKPFVEKNNVIAKNQKTIETLIGAGAGGESRGFVGRVDGLKIGGYQINDPIAAFSQDTKGAMAGGQFEANIGTQIMNKFKVFLDYGHNRMILEPNANFAKTIDWDMTGLSVLTEGSDFKTFRVHSVVEHSPAAVAGIRKEDLIMSVNGRPASDFMLAEIRELFKKPGECTLSIKRGQETLQIKLSLKRLI
jgi:hypothetical protein